jgi:NAD(P)-dependent dehydrogenase (short-subunit alcohol dehydrogenase family)
MTELFSISGKAAVVTGGSRGIGFMIAGELLKAGARRVYICARRAEACDAAAAELSRFGDCVSVPADVGDPEGVEKLARAVEDREERLEILVNNAGTAWGAPLETHPIEQFDRVLQVNVRAVFHMTQRLLPLLRAAASEADPARVINIGSIDGIHVPLLETYSYSASKAAVHQLTRHMAKRLAPSITVNAIAPGPFESKMMASTLKAFGEQIAASAPLKRIGRPDDVAGTAIFLASRAGAYLTGAVIPVDGGMATVGTTGPM